MKLFFPFYEPESKINDENVKSDSQEIGAEMPAKTHGGNENAISVANLMPSLFAQVSALTTKIQQRNVGEPQTNVNHALDKTFESYRSHRT